MKKVLTLGLCFVLSASAIAAPKKAPNPNAEPVDATEVEEPHGYKIDQEIRFGGSYRNFDYVESEGGRFLDGEKGKMPGVNAGYSIGFPKFFVDGDITYIDSHTTYTGSNQSGTIPIVSSTKTQLLEIEVDVGMPLKTPSESFSVKGYTGLGYHYWRRGEAALVNGVQDYRENYSWLVLPVGIRLETNLSETVKIGLDVAARLQAGGELVVKWSEIDATTQDTHLNLGAKVGYKFMLPVETRFTETVSLIVNPWYEYSAIGTSDTAEVKGTDGSGSGLFIHEPSSRTIQYGATIQVGVKI